MSYSNLLLALFNISLLLTIGANSLLATPACDLVFDPVDLTKASEILGREFIAEEGVAETLEVLHQIGAGKPGKNQSLAELGNFTPAQISQKYRGARRLGISAVKTHALIKAGILGGKNKKKNDQTKARKKAATAKAQKKAQARKTQEQAKPARANHSQAVGLYLRSEGIRKTDLAPFVLTELEEYFRSSYGFVSKEILWFGANDILKAIEYRKHVDSKINELNKKAIETEDPHEGTAIIHSLSEYIIENAAYVQWQSVLEIPRTFGYTELTKEIIRRLPQIDNKLAITKMDEIFQEYLFKDNKDYSLIFGYLALRPEIGPKIITRMVDIANSTDHAFLLATAELLLYKEFKKRHVFEGFLEIAKVRKSHYQNLLRAALIGAPLDLPHLQELLDRSIQHQNVQLILTILEINKAPELKEMVLDNFELIKAELDQKTSTEHATAISIVDIILEKTDGTALDIPQELKGSLLTIGLDKLSKDVQDYLIDNISLAALRELFTSEEKRQEVSRQNRIAIANKIYDKTSRPSLMNFNLSESEVYALVAISRNGNKEIARAALLLIARRGLKYDQGIASSLNNLAEIQKDPTIESHFIGSLKIMNAQRTISLLKIYVGTIHFKLLAVNLAHKLSIQQKVELAWFLAEEMPNYQINAGELDIFIDAKVAVELEKRILIAGFNDIATKVAFHLSSRNLIQQTKIATFLKSERQRIRDNKRDNYTKKPTADTNDQVALGSKTRASEMTLAAYIKAKQGLSPRRVVDKIYEQLRKNENIQGVEEALIALEVVPMADFLALKEAQRQKLFNAVLTTVGTTAKQNTLDRLMDCTHRYFQELDTSTTTHEHLDSVLGIYRAFFRKGTGATERINYLASLRSNSNDLVRQSAKEALADYMELSLTDKKPGFNTRLHIQSVFDAFNKAEDTVSKAILATELLPFAGFKNTELIEAIENVDLQAVPKEVLNNMIIVRDQYSERHVPALAQDSVQSKNNWDIKDTTIASNLIPQHQLKKFVDGYFGKHITQETRVRLLESISMRSVMMYELEHGRIPIDASHTHDGCDIWSVDFRTNQVRRIEVKSTRESSDFSHLLYLTHHQLGVARRTLGEEGKTFYVYTVSINNVNGKNTIQLYKDIDINPFGNEHIYNHDIDAVTARYHSDVLKPFEVEQND